MADHRTHNLPIIAAVALSAFPIAGLVILLYRYAVNVPFWDQWDVIYLFDQYDTGQLSFSDFWVQHNEHRLVFPKLMFFLLGVISRYNVRYEIAANVIVASLYYLAIVWHLHNNRFINGIETPFRVLWVISSFFIFSLIQWQNWLWGFQLQWFLCLFGVIFGAFVFSNFPINFKTLSLLFFFGIVATFSLSGGMLYWIVILFFLMIYAVKTRQTHMYRIAAVWVILFVLVLTLYLNHYQKPANHPNLLYSLDHPVHFLEYVLGYIGAPLAGDSLSDFNQEIFPAVSRAMAIGFFGVAAFVYCLIRHCYQSTVSEFQQSSFFLILGLFSILLGCLIAVGRCGFGVRFALESRYTTVSIGLWLSVFMMVCFSLTKKLKQSGAVLTGNTMIHYLTLFGIFFALCWSSYQGFPLFRKIYFEREYLKDAVLYGANPDVLNEVYPDVQRLTEVDIPTLKRLRLSVFEHFPELTDQTVFLFPQTFWHHDSGWELKGTFPNIQMKGETIPSYFFTSCGASPQKIGRIESESVRIDQPMWIRMLVNVGTNMKDQKIGVNIQGETPVELYCDVNIPIKNIQWMPYSFDLTPYVGRSFKVFAEDNSAGWKQCLGLVQPVMVYQR